MTCRTTATRTTGAVRTPAGNTLDDGRIVVHVSSAFLPGTTRTIVAIILPDAVWVVQAAHRHSAMPTCRELAGGAKSLA
jgi:hypothetical protein